MVAERGSYWRTLLRVVFVLTGIGLFSLLFDSFGLFFYGEVQLRGMPCANAGLGLALFMVLFVYVGLLTGIAILGGVLLWERSSGWGAAMLALANLLVMGFVGWWRPVEPGYTIFGLAVVALGL